MWKTALILIVSLIVLPVCTFYFDTAPNDLQLDLLKQTGIVYLAFALLCFIISSMTRNDSQVDKLWSILPIVYGWIVYFGAPEPRILIMAILISVWGLRLSYNFSRRGGYSWKFWTGDEDYRWEVLRAKPEFQPYWKWVLFRFFFICLYQLGLIWLITIPVIKSVGGAPLSIWDYILTVLTVALIIMETIADQQQFVFQNAKYKALANNESLTAQQAQGFISTGLWGKMRHPNYTAEQGIWVVIYLFSIIATGAWINWSIAGVILLILLFKGSSDFSEEISASKYPDYEQYQKEVPRFLPFRF